MREQGRVVEWNDERGFGFIVPLEGESRVFAHISEFPHEQRRPMATDLVSYVVARDERNRAQARQIAFMAPAHVRHEETALRLGAAELAIPTVFVIALVLLTATQRMPATVLLFYSVMSVIAFVTYWRDKVAAKHGEWRTSEGTLLGLAVFGGWPGAYLARHVLRHKTRKQPFRFYFWIAVAANCGMLVLVVSQVGQNPG